MIGGISSVWSGVSRAAARFDRAAVGLSAAAAAASSAAPDDAGTAQLPDALVATTVARFAFVASLRAAQVSNDMLAATLDLAPRP